MESNRSSSLAASTIFVAFPIAILIILQEAGVTGSWIFFESAIAIWFAWSGVCLSRIIELPLWARAILGIAFIALSGVFDFGFFLSLPFSRIILKCCSYVFLGMSIGDSIEENRDTLSNMLSFVAFLALSGFVYYVTDRTRVFYPLFRQNDIHLWIPVFDKYFFLITLIGSIFYCFRTAASRLVVSFLTNKSVMVSTCTCLVLAFIAILVLYYKMFLLILTPTAIVLFSLFLHNRFKRTA